jgi:hypothetical protein
MLNNNNNNCQQPETVESNTRQQKVMAKTFSLTVYEKMLVCNFVCFSS